LSRAELEGLLADPLSFVGTAPQQVERFVARVGEIVARHPEAATYRPGRHPLILGRRVNAAVTRAPPFCQGWPSGVTAPGDRVAV
jgi:hypothetical protein